MNVMTGMKIEASQVVDYLIDDNYYMQLIPNGVRAIIYKHYSSYSIQITPGIDIAKVIPCVNMFNQKEFVDLAFDVFLSKDNITHQNLFFDLATAYMDNTTVSDVQVHIHDVIVDMPFAFKVAYMKDFGIDLKVYCDLDTKLKMFTESCLDPNIKAISFKHYSMMYEPNSISSSYVVCMKGY